MGLPDINTSKLKLQNFELKIETKRSSEVAVTPREFQKKNRRSSKNRNGERNSSEKKTAQEKVRKKSFYIRFFDFAESWSCWRSQDQRNEHSRVKNHVLGGYFVIT